MDAITSRTNMNSQAAIDFAMTVAQAILDSTERLVNQYLDVARVNFDRTDTSIKTWLGSPEIYGVISKGEADPAPDTPQNATGAVGQALTKPISQVEPSPLPVSGSVAADAGAAAPVKVARPVAQATKKTEQPAPVRTKTKPAPAPKAKKAARAASPARTGSRKKV